MEVTGNKNIVSKHLDLASFESIRKFAEDINKTEERLDILINNAGGGLFTLRKTKDGCNMGMQVNHFGSFLLTHLLVGEYFHFSCFFSFTFPKFNAQKVNWFNSS